MSSTRHQVDEDLSARCTCRVDPVIAYEQPEAARRVGLSVRVLSDAISAGDLVAHYYGRKPLILRDDLVAWVQSLPTVTRRKR